MLEDRILKYSILEEGRRVKVDMNMKMKMEMEIQS